LIRNYFKKKPPHAAFLSFCLLFLCATPFNKQIFPKYFLDPSTKFDQGIYLNIAQRGYEAASETAFYPLWPLILGTVQSLFPAEFRVQTANIFSLAIFALSLVLVWKVARKISGEAAATWTVFLFALNPNSIFHALAYPESLFSLLSAGFLWFTIRFLEGPSLTRSTGVFLTAAAMSAARPIILQFIAAAVFALILIWFFFRAQRTSTGFFKNAANWLGISACGMAAGYIPYGLHCIGTFQDFFAPFNAQKHWDRKFGFYWSLITNPNSVSSSDNILTWDIQAFYLPAILLAFFVIWLGRSAKKQIAHCPDICSEPVRSFIILLCLLIAAAHSAIAFLTYPIFMSLARHVFSTPFFFFGAIAVLYSAAPDKPRTYLLRFYAFGSILYLVNFWTRFGNSAWMG
jgi:hypothetical protein